MQAPLPARGGMESKSDEAMNSLSSGFFLSLFDRVPTWAVLVPIFVCSIVLLAVVIERLVFFRKINLDYRLLIRNIAFLPGSRKGKHDEASSVLAPYSGPLVDMMRGIIDTRNSMENRELVIRDISERTIIQIERYAGIVATIATVSTMLGLFGTITGMMKSFSSLSQFGQGAQELLARGIAEALITTALGLTVAIPAIMFYNYLVSRIDYYVKEVEFIANSLNDIMKK